MSGDLLIFGDFSDYMPRLSSYCSIARSHGLRPFVFSDLASSSAITTENSHFLLNDENIIRSFSEVSVNNSNQPHVLERAKSMRGLSDKLNLRQRSQKQFPHIFDFIDVTRNSNVAEFRTRLNEREWVIKPQFGGLGKGVKRIETPQDFEIYFSIFSDQRELIPVEEYVEGDHVCVDFFLDGSSLEEIGSCSKVMLNAQMQIASAHIADGGVPKSVLKDITKRVADLLHDMGIDFGPATVFLRRLDWSISDEICRARSRS